MKKLFYMVVSITLLFFIVGCNDNSNQEEVNEFKITTNVSDGYSLEGDVYTFTKPGEYKVKGNLNGTLYFSESIADSVLLYLDNAIITAKNNHAIYWASSNGKIEIKSTDESNNVVKTIANGSKVYSAIESENNIEIGGSGNLSIIGGQRHAVKGSNITIKGNSKIDIKAVKDGLHGKHILFTGSDVTIHECTDAIQADVNSSNLKGTIVVEGGTILINNCKRAFRAETSVLINKASTNLVIKVNNTKTLYETPTFNYKSGTLLVNGKEYK